MTLTHHPVRLFRLSCGCLRAYPMMPVTHEHTVLCVSCHAAATTILAYPEARCAVTGWHQPPEGRRIRVSCTNPPAGCSGTHYDHIIAAAFAVVTASLARSREGKTGRA